MALETGNNQVVSYWNVQLIAIFSNMFTKEQAQESTDFGFKF